MLNKRSSGLNAALSRLPETDDDLENAVANRIATIDAETHRDYVECAKLGDPLAQAIVRFHTILDEHSNQDDSVVIVVSQGDRMHYSLRQLEQELKEGSVIGQWVRDCVLFDRMEVTFRSQEHAYEQLNQRLQIGKEEGTQAIKPKPPALPVGRSSAEMSTSFLHLPTHAIHIYTAGSTTITGHTLANDIYVSLNPGMKGDTHTIVAHINGLPDVLCTEEPDEVRAINSLFEIMEGHHDFLNGPEAPPTPEGTPAGALKEYLNHVFGDPAAEEEN